jgi:hypothetical protein
MTRVYSNKPSAIKARIRKTEKRMKRDDEDIKLLFPDRKPIEEWDFEELQAGRPRDPETGKLNRRAKRPKWINPAMLAEAQKRLRTMTATELGTYTGSAIEVMVDLMQSSRVDKVRYDAARYVLDQVMGMPTQRTEISAEVSVSTFLADVIENPDGTQYSIEDGQVLNVEYDEDDEDDDGE